MNDYQTVCYQTKNRVAIITLNRPEVLNAFDVSLRSELLSAIKRANADPDVRVVIITGAGKAFCAGTDLKDGLGDHPDAESKLRLEYKPFLSAILESAKLYISAINGACAGIGGSLALSCDLAVMADNAYLYQAFALVGQVPDGGMSYFLARSLGYKRALQLIVEAGRLTASECLDCGLVNKVVPADQLLQSAQQWAESLAEGSPLVHKHSKRLLRQAMDELLPVVFDLEAESQSIMKNSEDHKLAVKAFFNKQKPVFRER